MGISSGQVHQVNGTASNPGPDIVDLTDGNPNLVSREVIIRNAEPVGGNDLLIQLAGKPKGDYFALVPNGGISAMVEAKSIAVKGSGGGAAYEIIVVYRS